MHVEYLHFPSRRIRAEYIARRFHPLLTGKKVLDVGCDKALLKALVPQMTYTGIDMGGEPDIHINLEKIDRLPFDDNTFDTVLCSDVLEHIDNLHQIFGELVRVARGHVIISLPNNWSSARLPLKRGRGSFAHYGLPITPIPDRHKWFFCLGEAKTFVEAQQDQHPVAITDLFATEKRRFTPLRVARRAFHRSQESYLNRYSNTLWTVFAKHPLLSAG